MKVRDVLGGFEDYLKERKRFNPNSIIAYISDVYILLDTAEISEKLSAKNLSSIGTADVQKYMISGNSSSRTQRRKWSTAAKFLGYCIMEGIITDNPADNI